MPRTWKDWLNGAEQTENRKGWRSDLTKRINIDPDTFPGWCLRNECSVDREGRQKGSRHGHEILEPELKFRSCSLLLSLATKRTFGQV
jgi:hypothetical protein